MFCGSFFCMQLVASGCNYSSVILCNKYESRHQTEGSRLSTGRLHLLAEEVLIVSSFCNISVEYF